MQVFDGRTDYNGVQCTVCGMSYPPASNVAMFEGRNGQKVCSVCVADAVIREQVKF